jgi:hypothetical protein
MITSEKIHLIDDDSEICCSLELLLQGKYPPAKPGALWLEPLKAAEKAARAA